MTQFQVPVLAQPLCSFVTLDKSLTLTFRTLNPKQIGGAVSLVLGSKVSAVWLRDAQDSLNTAS